MNFVDCAGHEKVRRGLHSSWGDGQIFGRSWSFDQLWKSWMAGMERGGRDASTALLGVHFDDGFIRIGVGPNQGCSCDSILT